MPSKGFGAQSFSDGASLAAATVYGIALPFVATEIVIVNDGAKDLHVRFGSTGGASTDDWYLKPAESQTWHFLCDGLAMVTTATSCCRVGAWRS